MRFVVVAKLLGGLLVAAALGGVSLAQLHAFQPDLRASSPVRRSLTGGTVVDLAARKAIVAPAPSSTRAASHMPSEYPASQGEPVAVPAIGPYTAFLPGIIYQAPNPPPLSNHPEPPAVTPAPNWPDGRDSQTASKLGIHVVQNNDPYIMEFVRRARPRVMKSVDDLGWLMDVKKASPNTVTVGRINQQNEGWADHKKPEDAARDFINQNLFKYTVKDNQGVDYWEGWNEYVPGSVAHWQWYAAFEAARACDMQALGLHAAIGGFAAGTPEYDQMAYFIPALEAAHRCGAIFTLHEGVSPLPGCGVYYDKTAVIPGAPNFSGIMMGYMMLRYRFWYEGYLKPRGLGDVPLVISELAVGGIVPGQPCNGPGGSGWKGFSSWWVQNGIGPDGPHAWANLLAWYDSQIRRDSYVIGTTIFTAGAQSGGPWNSEDLHDVMIPLADYETTQP